MDGLVNRLESKSIMTDLNPCNSIVMDLFPGNVYVIVFSFVSCRRILLQCMSLCINPW